MSEWQTTTLDEIASWSGGLTPSKSNPAFWEGGTIPWLSSKEVTGGVLRATEHRVTEAAVRETSLRLIPADSVAVVVRSGVLLHTLPVALVPFDCVVNQDIKIGVPAEMTSAPFLRLLLEFNASRILDRLRKTGTTVQSIDVPGLLRWPVRLPPPAEQKRIVDLVAALDSQIEALEREADSASRAVGPAVDSLLAADVTWPTTPLGEVGAFVRGKRFTKAEYTDHGLGCIHYGHVHTHFGPIATEVIAHLPDEARTRLRLAAPGDVVVAATSEDVEGLGKATAWLGKDEVAVHDDCQIFKHRLAPAFAAFLFASPAFQAQKVQYAAGSKVTRISGADLARIAVPIPPRAVQERIGCALAELDAHTSRVRSELDALRTFRSVLLSALLSQSIAIPESYDDLVEVAS